MRNSFELLDWLKQHIEGGGGGAADVPLADSVTPGIVKLTHEVGHEEAEHTAVAPDGVAAYVDGGFVPLKAEATETINGITNEKTTGTASCIQGTTGVIVTLNLKVTANLNEAFVSFPLHHHRFSTMKTRVIAGGSLWEVTGANGNLMMFPTANVTSAGLTASITIPYF